VPIRPIGDVKSGPVRAVAAVHEAGTVRRAPEPALLDERKANVHDAGTVARKPEAPPATDKLPSIPGDAAAAEKLVEAGKYDEAIAIYRLLAKKHRPIESCAPASSSARACARSPRAIASRPHSASKPPRDRSIDERLHASSPTCGGKPPTNAKGLLSSSWERRIAHVADHRIDLGTTNSCVAVLDEKGFPRPSRGPTASARSRRGELVPQGQITVGQRARRQGVTNAAATIFGAKRLIGRKVNADDVSCSPDSRRSGSSLRPTETPGSACTASRSRRRRSPLTSCARSARSPRKRSASR